MTNDGNSFGDYLAIFVTLVPPGVMAIMAILSHM